MICLYKPGWIGITISILACLRKTLLSHLDGYTHKVTYSNDPPPAYTVLQRLSLITPRLTTRSESISICPSVLFCSVVVGSWEGRREKLVCFMFLRNIFKHTKFNLSLQRDCVVIWSFCWNWCLLVFKNIPSLVFCPCLVYQQ